MSKLILFPHPERRLQLPWNFLQWGLFLFPLLPIFGGLAIILGAILSWRRNWQQILQNPVSKGLLILSLLLIILAALAYYPLEALIGLSNFIPYFFVFLGLSVLIQNPAQLSWLSWLIVIPAIPIDILGLGQQFLGWSGIEVLKGILGWALQPNGNPVGRMSSVFMYANIFAAYLVIIFTLAIGLLIQEWRNFKQKNFNESPDQNLKFPLIQENFVKPEIRIILLIFTILLTAIALILTNSRNAWGLAILTSLAYGLYLGWWWLLILVITPTTAILGAAFFPSPLRDGLRNIIPAYFWQRLTDQNFVRPVETLRITQWKFAWNLAQTRPLTGWGLRNFTPLYEAQMNIWLGHPHNLFLMMIAEIGFPATLLFLAIVGGILGQATLSLTNFNFNQNDQLILYSYLVSFGACILFNTVDVTLFDFRVNTLVWILLSAIWGVVKQQKTVTNKPEMIHRPQS